MFLRGASRTETQNGIPEMREWPGSRRSWAVLRRTQCRVPIPQRQANEAEWLIPTSGASDSSDARMGSQLQG